MAFLGLRLGVCGDGDGIPVFGQPGMLPAAALDELLQKVRELDMDAVRAKVVAAETETAAASA